MAQFLRDQNGDRKKEKRFNKKNKKFIPLPIKGNILPQDSTFIFSENKKPDIMKNISTALFPFPVQLANLPYSSISLNISYKY